MSSAQPESVDQAKEKAKDTFKNIKDRKPLQRLDEKYRCCKFYDAKCKTRAIPVLNVINILIMILGVLIFLVGCIQSGEIHAPEKVYDMIPGGFDVSQKTMGVGMILLGIFCVALAVFGFMQTSCGGPFSTLFYIIFAGLFAFILIIIGMILGGFAGDTMFLEIKDSLCTSTKTNIKAQYDRAVNAQMCSSQCPCDGTIPGTQELWDSYYNPVPDQEDTPVTEKLNTLAYFGRDFSNVTMSWPQYGSSGWYGRSTYKKKIPLKFVKDGFKRTVATTVESETNSVGAIGDFVQFDEDCECQDLPTTAFSNVQDTSTMGTGLNGKCATGSGRNYPWCYVKETCRGSSGTGWKLADGTAMTASGKSKVALTGTSIPWQRCAGVGNTTAQVPVAKPAFRTLAECYNHPETPYGKNLTAQLGTLAPNSAGKMTFTGSPSNTGAVGTRPWQWRSTFTAYVKKFITSNGMEILSELEDKYDCASVCEVPMFYITKDISEGRPTQECAAGIYHSMKGSYKAEAAFSIICSLCLWVAMACAIMIGCGPDLDNPEDQGAETDAKDEGVPPRAAAYEEKKEEVELPNTGAINNDPKEEIGSLPQGE